MTRRRGRSEPAALGPDDGDHAEVRQAFARAAAEAHERNQERRARVLAHADLAERVKAVLGLRSASNWNGYVPPATDSSGALNSSHIRRELVRIGAEAFQREQVEAAGEAS